MTLYYLNGGNKAKESGRRLLLLEVEDQYKGYS